MSLTPKQEKFCVEYVKTGSGVAAYKAAYSAGKMSDTSIHKEVKSLLKHPSISPRIAALQAPAAQKAQITLESHLDRLQELSEKAENSNQLGAAINAEVARGKAIGIYVDRVKVDMKMDIGEIDSKIASLMAKLATNGARQKRS